MGTNRDAVTVPGTVEIALAQVGVAAPVDETVALGAGWYVLGFSTEDGTQFVPSDPNFVQRRAHQSDWPVRTIQTSDAARIQADMMQLDANTIVAVLGGGTITVVSPGHYKYTPPKVGGRKEFAACVTAIDGTKRYRWIVPLVLQTEGATFQLHKGEETQPALRLEVQGSDIADGWYLLSNDPALNPVGTLAA